MTVTQLASAALIAAAAFHCASAQTKISGAFTQSTTGSATAKTPTYELGGSAGGTPMGPKSYTAATASATTAPGSQQLSLNDQLDGIVADWPYGFRLVSQANNNVVGTGSDGRLRSWVANGNKDQVWRFVRDGSRFRLQNLQNDQFACIAWNGWYWRNTDNIATFTLVPGTTAGTKAFRLQENTKSEYFSVGGDGGMVRWAATNQTTQEFGLQPIGLIGMSKRQEGSFGDTLMTQVSASSDGAEIWALDNEGSPARLTLAGASVTWTVMKLPIPFKQIAVGSASNIWAIGSDGKIYKNAGTSWNQMPGTLTQISAAADGTVVGVNAADEIFRFENGNWTRLPGLLRSVSAGSAQNIWGVNAAGQVWRWANSTWQAVNGGVTTQVGELSFKNIRSVSVSRNGLVVGIDSAQRAFHWTGIAWLALNTTIDKVTGLQALDANVMPNALAGADGNVYALSADGKPFLAAYKR